MKNKLRNFGVSLLLGNILYGCSLVHEIIPQVPNHNIPRTSLTTENGEKRKLFLDNIADYVYEEGKLERDDLLFVDYKNYVGTCKTLGIDYSVEPPIVTGTRL